MVTRLVLILGDQLTPDIAALKAADPARDVVIMAEVRAEGTTVTFPVSDLEYEREYAIDLRNFRDAVGNALDDEPV